MRTERDTFAAQAMKALLAGRVSLNDEDAKHVAVMAYRAADAMMAVTGRGPRCWSCFDGRRAHQRVAKDNSRPPEKLPCPHCGVDPVEAMGDDARGGGY